MKQIYSPITILISILFLLFGCVDTRDKQKAIRNNIVLILDTIKTNYDTLAVPQGGELIKYGPILTFKSEMVGEYLTPLTKIETDTLVLSTKSDHLFINYRYSPMSELSFIAKKGDTIRISEKQNTPFCTVLNRKAKDHDVNYDFWKKARYGSVYDYSTEDYYLNKGLCYVTRGVSWQTAKGTIIKTLIEELRDEDIWLDSLYHNQLISEYEYDIYDTRNKYKLLTLEVGYKDAVALKGYLRQYNDSLFRNDHMGFYSNFYYNKFIKESNDTVLINNLSKKYHYLFDKDVNNSQDIELIDRFGRRLHFESLIKKHKGKIIYADFLASWCAPCLAEMPASKQLREKYADKKIAFVYLAINDKEDAWRKAISTAELSAVEDNYFILNNKTSKVLEGLNIRSIPRYLIYNNGKLIQPNAPRPSDKQINTIWDKLLRESN